MFKEISQLFGMMRNPAKLKEEMDKLQQKIGQLTAEGDAGAGMVKIKVNGKMEMVGCQISDDALRLNDREMLEDMIRAATNQALTKMRKKSPRKRAKWLSGSGCPPE